MLGHPRESFVIQKTQQLLLEIVLFIFEKEIWYGEPRWLAMVHQLTGPLPVEPLVSRSWWCSFDSKTNWFTDSVTVYIYFLKKVDFWNQIPTKG